MVPSLDAMTLIVKDVLRVFTMFMASLLEHQRHRHKEDLYVEDVVVTSDGGGHERRVGGNAKGIL